MSTLRQAAQQALACLNEYAPNCTSTITSLRQALEAEQQVEPVAWINWCAATGQRSLGWQCESELASEPLYHAAQPAQQPLTDEQIVETLMPLPVQGTGYFLRIARAVERAHGIGGEK